MKISIKLLLLLSILLSGVFACKKEHCNPTKGITGEWIWVESVGGIGGWTETPETGMLTRKLKIDDFFFRSYVNDSLVLETQYDLGISDHVLLGTEERTFIRFASGEEQAIIIGTKELELIDQCYDCFYHKYRRK